MDKDSQLWRILRQIAIFVEMKPEIRGPDSHLGRAGSSELAVGIHRFPQDPPEIDDRSTEIKVARFPAPKRGCGCLNFSTLLVDPIAARK